MRSLVATLLLATVGSPLAAQGAAAPGSTWKFSNLIGAYCIYFLVSPDDASGLLPNDASPERLDAVKGVHPALARVMADQPEYASWMPAAFCLYRFGRAELEGRELLAADGSAEVFGILAYAARVTRDQPDDGLAVQQLFTTDGRMEKAARDSKVDLQKLSVTFGKAQHGTDDRHTVAWGSSRMIWDGHALADSQQVSEPVDQVWVARGPGGKPMGLRWHLNAQWRRTLVGALVVEGKDKLAKAIRKSPIRFVGPLYNVGDAQLELP